MKEIPKVKAYIKNDLQSIIAEKEILQNLSHPFIVNLYYSYQDTDNLYLILDYLPGGCLRYHLCEQGIFTETQIKFFISNLILALEYIHFNNIIHRDLKPENLIFDANGYLHLTDFGISRRIDMGPVLCDISGTPGYISPEMILNEPQNQISDYFSVGIITYELVFGKRPFQGNNKTEIAENILYKKINLNKANIPAGFSEECADFINRLLKKKSSERLGKRGINEIKGHLWIREMDWISIENKVIREDDIPFIPGCVDVGTDIIQKKDSKIEKYSSILKKINEMECLKNFYFNCYEKDDEGKEGDSYKNGNSNFCGPNGNVD